MAMMNLQVFLGIVAVKVVCQSYDICNMPLSLGRGKNSHTLTLKKTSNYFWSFSSTKRSRFSVIHKKEALLCGLVVIDQFFLSLLFVVVDFFHVSPGPRV